MQGLRCLALAAVFIAACARMAPPPGGPTRITPPLLTATLPADTVCTLPDFRGAAEFFFDEVVSEGSQPNFGRGTGDLEKLVLLSPDTMVPVVRWRRNRITVRPRHGWLPNTVYRIELASGVADLRNNLSKTPGLITFVTGPSCPTRSLSGRAVDWSTKAGISHALIEAIHLPDSAGYRMNADSNGRFRLGPLPDGSYLVYAVIDQNRDHKRQTGEPWDTVRAAASQDTVGEIWAFPRDTLPPKIQTIARQDSISIAVTFTKPIDPYQHLDSTMLRVGLVLSGDTVSIGPLMAYPKATFDTVYRPPPVPRTPARDSAARRDSLARDSAAARVAARPERRVSRGAVQVRAVDSVQQKRPALGTVLVIRTRGRVELGKSYFVEVRGLRSAGGVSGPAVGKKFDTPKPPSAADSAKARADSARADSLKRLKPNPGKARPDSTKPALPSKVKPDSAILGRRR
jgi:hypothetical protein